MAVVLCTSVVSLSQCEEQYYASQAAFASRIRSMAARRLAEEVMRNASIHEVVKKPKPEDRQVTEHHYSVGIEVDLDNVQAQLLARAAAVRDGRLEIADMIREQAKTREYDYGRFDPQAMALRDLERRARL